MIETRIEGGVRLEPIGPPDAGVKRFRIIPAGSVFHYVFDMGPQLQEELAQECALTNEELAHKLERDEIGARIALDQGQQPNGGQPVKLPPNLRGEG